MIRSGIPITIPFTKMHGIGNDYIYVNGFEVTIADPARLAPKIADRHFGVGADGLILILPPEKSVEADVRMRMFNADGSESEMCGNGIRCVCKFAHDRGICIAHPMRIQTGAGILELTYTLNALGKVELVTVDMGEPRFQLSDIPVNIKRLSWFVPETHAGGVETGTTCWIGTFVSMGNPHMVLFNAENRESMGAELQRFELEKWGPLLEHHEAFPKRMNIHFVDVRSPQELTMRTWERGSGITLACGTGAAAVCAAGVLTNRTNRDVLIHLPGGDLQLRWDQNSNHIFKTGPATDICTGEWSG